VGISEDQFARCMSHVIETDGHWIWTGSNNRSGGRIMIGGIRMQARRLFWEHYNGEIPEKHKVTPTCGEYLCVNPHHLLCATDVVIQSMAQGSVIYGTDPFECPSGHKREIAYLRCQVCNRQQVAKSKEREKSK
jgi:hypothetical protein